MVDKKEDPLDKLKLPPVDDTGVKLTFTTLKTKSKAIEEEMAAVNKQQQLNIDKVNKIIKFVEAVKKQQKNNEELNKGLVQVIDELKNVQKVVHDDEMSPENVFKAGKDLDDTIDEVKEYVKANAENNKKFQKLMDAHEEKLNDSLKNASGSNKILGKIGAIGEWFNEKATLFRKTTGLPFCGYVNNVVTKSFNTLVAKIPLLTKFFNVLKVAGQVITWLGKGGITIIEGIFGVFTKLASIGWNVMKNVFSIVTYPVKVVSGFFADVIKSFIASPLGLLSFVGILEATLYFGAKPLVKFLSGILGQAWDWLTDTWNKYIADPMKQLGWYQNFLNAKETVVGWFSDAWDFLTNKERLKGFYNSTIGQIPGFSIENISNLFTKGWGYITEAWDIAKDGFNLLYEHGIFDELILLWQAMKALVMSNEDIINSNLAEENKQNINAGYSVFIKKEIESLVQSNVLQAFFDRFNGEKTPEVINQLVQIADGVVRNYLQTKIVSKDDKKNREILSGININVKSLVLSLLDTDTSQLQKLYKTSGHKTDLYKAKLLALSRIENQKDRGDSADSINYQLKQILGKNTDKELPTLVGNKVYSSNTPIPSRADRLETSMVPEYDPSSVHFSSGGIVNAPIHALIGEGKAPEIILPINTDGVAFVYNSMKKFIIDNMENEPLKKQTTKDIVRRVQRGQVVKPDAKVYDMKNLSTGIIGFS